MGTVIDLHQRGYSAVDETADERLGGQYLADDPLTSYVGADEHPAYVLVNKRGGASVERAAGSETYKPGRGYRTLVAVTDVRLLVAVGGADDGGDRVVSIPLSTLADVETESGLLGGALVVETDGGERWSIPCRGDLGDVVAYLEHAQRAWAKADRFVAEAGDRLDRARARLDDGAYEDALEAASETLSILAHGRESLTAFEMGEGVVANADFARRRTAVRTVQRRAHAGLADEHRDAATDHREAERYREAHEHLRQSIAALDRALAIDAETPDDETLTARRRTARRERAALERLPATIAADALGAAREETDPGERADGLVDALERHRELLGLCWGPEAAFEGEASAVRERIVTIVDELVAARIDAARASVVAADRLHTRGEPEAARAKCDRAAEQVADAREVATELLPDRVAAIDAWEPVIDDQRARIDGAAQTVADPDVAAGDAVDDEAEGAVAGIAMDDEETIGGIAMEDQQQAGFRSLDAIEQADEPAGDEPPSGLSASLRALEQSAFTELVAKVWRALGWETTAFTAAVDQYDVMATRRNPIELRVLVWAIHRPDEELGTAVVDRCATDRANVDGADVAVIVTTGTIPPAVRERADEHNVKVLDRSDFVDLLERESLTDLITATG